MASRGRGRRGRLRGTGQAPPVFDKQAFTEAVGITTAAIAQASIAGRQEDPSNSRGLRRIILRHSQGEGDPEVTGHWFIQIEKVLEAMEITSNATRIRLATFRLEGEAQIWWKWTRTFRDLEAMTRAEFQELLWVRTFQRLRKLRSS